MKEVSLNKGKLWVGTSNVVLPGSKLSFPVEFQSKSRLHYYSSLFNTVEVNSAFRKIPLGSTFEKWSHDVHDDFQFTIKLWKEISHIKKLAIDFRNIDRFFAPMNKMNKKGCLLLQFPGSITLDYFAQVEQILHRLCELDDDKLWRKAVEFRSATWHVGETYELLNEFDASMVLHDMPKSKNYEPNGKEQFLYTRFHGPTGNYKGDYSHTFLLQEAERIDLFLNNGKDVYVYFNNTVGNAFENALSFKLMMNELTDFKNRI